LNGTVRIDPDGVRFDVSPLPARQYWEGRVLFPAEAVAGLPLASTDLRVNTVLAEERAWADQANALREAARRQLQEDAALRARREALAQRLLPISIGLIPAGLLAWYLAYRRHGRPHDVASHVVPGELPSDHPPALVGYLLSRTVDGSAIVATLLDLARRGYLEIRETTATKSGLFGKKEAVDYRFDRTAAPLEGVEPFERDLLAFLIRQGDGRSSFTMSALEKAASKRASGFHTFFTAWVKQVKALGKARAFYEPYAAGAMGLNVAIGVAVALAGIAFCVVTQSPVGVPAILGGLLVASLTPMLNRRTVEGRRLHVAWVAFRSHLTSVSESLGPVAVDSHAWGRYLAASVIFGLHTKVLPKLQPIDDRGQHVVPVWYAPGHGDSLGSSVASLSSSVSSMVASVSTSMSSASGTGGGASAGGGGGSGGGGGGAG
jgi:uncharacterized membrane protein